MLGQDGSRVPPARGVHEAGARGLKDAGDAEEAVGTRTGVEYPGSSVEV